MDVDLQAVTDVPGLSGSSARPVLLVHGWTGSGEDFERIVPALAADRRVVVPDLPGHGRAASSGDGGYSLGAHVRVLLELLDALGLGEVHLVGHSHGGLVAQHLAAAASQRIASMALVGSGLGAVGDAMREVVTRVSVAAATEGAEAAWREIVAAEAADGDPRAAFARKRFLAMPVEAITGVARNLLVTEPLGAFLRGIDLPVLVCHGEGDTTWLPHEQQLLARRITGARYHVVPDALHSPAQENPDGLLAVLQPFLSQAEARADALAAAPTTPPPRR